MAAGARVASEREALGYSQQKLATMVTRLGYKITQTGIDKIEKRDAQRPKCAKELAIALNVSEDWLVKGREPKERSDTPVLAPAKVPVITWVSAGAMASDPTQQDIIKEVSAPDLDPKGRWIALRVDGDSMDRISPPGSTIFVNLKDRRLVTNACYIIVNDDGEASYKRFRANPARFEPVSTNPAHEPIFPDGEPAVVGRVRRSVIEM